MTQPGHIRPRSDDFRPAAERTGPVRGLPSDLLREAARRLELAALCLGAAYAVVLVLDVLAAVEDWRLMPRPAAHAALSVAMITISAAVAWTARAATPPARLLDLGLLYEVVVAFAIAMGDNLAPLSSERPLETISWLCVWIVIFPLVVPATPARTLLASLAAASMWPLAFAVGLRLGNPAPPSSIVLLNFLENYLAAVMALVPSFVVRRLGAAVAKAREMGSYELLERLDRGGMGEVWRARHRMLARPAAVKLIRPEMLGDGRVAETLVRRFEREAQATAALHSPHTVELYDFGVTRDGTFYYVMEILEGIDLESLVRRFGPVPAERAVHFLLQACDSLADAHHGGLVHRDIKPANLFACRRGLKYDFLKVLDFGLVKSSWADDVADTRLTAEGMAAGTPAYMAPEVAMAASALDGRADLYGLGCVAYWLVTGEHVFKGSTPMQVALQHVQAAPVPPSQRTALPPPPALEEAILWCLEKDPGRRPADADALAARLSATGLGALWTPARARQWWEEHVPGATSSTGADAVSTGPSLPTL
jgi:plasmid stabilization system protein ParE